MKYRVAERFKSIQGEGVYAGTPMAFVRFVGCSVGKKICQHCDTDFDEELLWRGGGEFAPEELLAWAGDYEHICLTGGEPMNQDLLPLINFVENSDTMLHMETSGTVPLDAFRYPCIEAGVQHWICVSPKPGFLEESIQEANEVKVIVPGLGINPPFGTHWPTLEEAIMWAEQGKTVFLQPRNAKYDVDKQNMLYVLDLLRDHPQLRLSAQLHKILRVQ